MNHKDRIHSLLDEMSNESLSFIKASESNSSHTNGWVPAIYIKNELGLKFSAYPIGNKTDNKTGWFFATLTRYLEGKNKVEFKKEGGRSFYRTI